MVENTHDDPRRMRARHNNADLLRSVQEKWALDVPLIATVLAEMERQLSLASLRLSFRQEGPKPPLVGVGKIFGTLAGMPVDLILNVLPTGEISVDRIQPLDSASDDSSHVLPTISVLEADKSQYERLIASLIGIE